MYSENTIEKISLVVFDCVMLFFSFTIGNLFYDFNYSIVFILFVSILTIFVTILFNGYSLINRRNFWEDFPYIINFVLYAFVIHLSCLILIIESSIINLSLFIFQYLFLILLISISRLVLKYLFKSISKRPKIIVLTTFKNFNATKKIIDEERFNVIAYMSNNLVNGITEPILKNFDDVRYFLTQQEVNAIYVTNDALKEFNEAKEYFTLLGLPLIINVTSLDSANYLKTNLLTINNESIVIYSLKTIRTTSLILKKCLDITIALFGIMLTFLVAIIINPIVQKESKGPLFFKQKRVGKNGKIFEMYKFRSMYLDAEERKKDLLETNLIKSEYMFKMDDDPRVFPFGQKIRDWSLDELPQFFNVLKGDMSIVGTRPPTIEEYKKYKLHHFKRLAMKPGITGMWQVSGRSNITDFEEVVRLDLKYIKDWSLLLDFKIILKTILVVLRRNGAK